MERFASPIHCEKNQNLVINREDKNFLRQNRLDSFESVWANKSGTIIKNIKPRSVVRIQIVHPGRTRTLYLKRHKPEFIGFRQFFRLWTRRKSHSQGMLEFENICEFRKNGIPTVPPLAAGEKRIDFFRAKSFLLTEDFHPYISLEYLLATNPDSLKGPAGIARKKTLIKKISALAKRMHKSGFNHRDFNATHILLHYTDQSDEPALALFDLQRVEKHSFLRIRWKIKSLARLNYSLPETVFTEQDRLDLLLFYNGRKTPGLMDRLQWFWIRKKTDRIRRHTEKEKTGKPKNLPSSNT